MGREEVQARRRTRPGRSLPTTTLPSGAPRTHMTDTVTLSYVIPIIITTTSTTTATIAVLYLVPCSSSYISLVPTTTTMTTSAMTTTITSI